MHIFITGNSSKAKENTGWNKSRPLSGKGEVAIV
jgi:hypothetical protein